MAETEGDGAAGFSGDVGGSRCEETRHPGHKIAPWGVGSAGRELAWLPERGGFSSALRGDEVRAPISPTTLSHNAAKIVDIDERHRPRPLRDGKSAVLMSADAGLPAPRGWGCLVGLVTSGSCVRGSGAQNTSATRARQVLDREKFGGGCNNSDRVGMTIFDDDPGEGRVMLTGLR